MKRCVERLHFKSINQSNTHSHFSSYSSRLVVVVFILVVFPMVVFTFAHCCNMDGIAPHGDTHVFDTAEHAPISSSTIVQEGCPEE